MGETEGTKLIKVVETDPLLDFFAGTVAGIAALIVGFPFDTVKVRFQNPSFASRYRSTFHALSTIIREERLSGYYRGIASPLLTAAPLNGVVFSSYRFFLKAQLSHKDTKPTLTEVALAGAGSGIFASIITTPTELIKIRQQSLNSGLHTSSPLIVSAVALKIFKDQGLKGFYRGVTATALRDVGYGTYFAAYEATLRYFSAPPPASHDQNSLSKADSMAVSHSWPALLLAGGIAGTTSWISTFPLDVIKTRVQSTSGGGDDPYRTTLSTIIHSYRAEGSGVFFRGLTPTLIRAIPVNMVTFSVFETIVHAFS